MERSRQRVWLNVGLGVTLAGLGAGVYFAQEKPEPPKRLTPLTPSSVLHITLHHPDKPDIVLEKQGNAWQLTAPVDSETDPFQVEGILSLAQQEFSAQYPAAEMTLSEIGLDPPQYTVTLNDTRLEMGDTDPLLYRRYVKVGEQVLLTTDPPSTGLDADYSDLVSAALIPKNLKIIAIETPQFSAQFDESGKASVTPKKASPSDEAPKLLIESWKNARSLWRAMKTPADKPIPGDTVRVLFGNGSERKFAVVARQPQLKLLRADLGVVYTLAPALGAELFQLMPPKPTKETAAQESTAKDPSVESLLDIAPETMAAD